VEADMERSCGTCGKSIPKLEYTIKVVENGLISFLHASCLSNYNRYRITKKLPFITYDMILDKEKAPPQVAGIVRLSVLDDIN